MILKEQRKELKKILGYHYTAGVLKILKEKKETIAQRNRILGL
ncbi:hypothetical protein IMCC3317_27550 [Kordia antarctica]|uniref:Uncharacterized protein n=1 Tax=Kordia antarctica TaxID=1218801 RepID=A0A7L4ZMF2_9FLAO|nr:hypothetical protein [Kordia antarctica]QHI37376.1 hypothetical protein IMCC3317_27550 [Kordia antarctica]